MTVESLKRLIAESTEVVWNQGNVDAIERYYTPDYVHHDVARPDVQTLAEYRSWMNEVLAGLEDLDVETQEVIAEQDIAVARWTVRGTHTGWLAGIPATGRRVLWSGVSVYRAESNRIAESWYVYDMLGLLQQIGMCVVPVAVTT